ncbi:Non-histone protein 10 [Choanephora cucurbitarum]|uniref:Non-histone protein 10 n=1 Tax=Choanephora cucurbitarum TaxID=101091 RepID=A0A1C7NNA3_9FUNG|nr:Non-histone protein 10 [Choanephora cucurbitarum]
MSLQEEKGDKKLQDYKKRLREIEIENEQLGTRLVKARHHIKRLRIERIVLLEEIDELKQARSSRSKKSNGLFLSGGAESDSEMSVSESIMSDVKNGGGKRNAAAAPRKKRDPNAPKGPGNVFFLYCRMERDNIKDEVPNESLGEVTRLLGQKWKALTKEEKQKYYDIYKKEQEEYESAMKSYTAAGGGVEGAAAVEANKSTKQDGEEDDESEEEIDMLQDDEDEDDDEDEEDEDEDEEAVGDFGEDRLEHIRLNAISSLINPEN